MKNLFPSKLLNSRIQSDNTTKYEQILGYFLGPCLVYMMYTGVAGTYLTQFYTDVLGLAGGFLTMMPLISKILTGMVSLYIGRLIDRTHTTQGKARPWILASGILLAVCGIMLYAVPKASYEIRVAWVVFSYNLLFSLAFSTYSLSHSLMVPLSTRDTKQRDSLAMLTSTGTAMIPGMLVTIVMPLLVKSIGVGSGAQGTWVTVMSILSILAIPATLMEYYFTRERVTTQIDKEHGPDIAFGKQIKACFRDKYWLMVIGFTLVLHLGTALSSQTMLYYCNWVLGNSINSGAAKQILVNAIGQAPMGFGVVILWPLVRKFGKRKVSMIGFVIAALGCLGVLLGSNSLPMVLACLFVKSIGALPTYVMAALLAEALDDVEAQNGFRADGFSASVNSIILTVVQGIGQTILLAGISAFGYITPDSTTQVITQPDAIRTFFSWSFAGLPMVGYIICAIIMFFYRIDINNQNHTEGNNG
jgi:GPH family glycoside/pentoside/hexuronide:cation symporter